MVGFLQSSAIEEARKEEKEDVSLSASGKLSIPNDPLDLCIPELEDFSASFSDSFFDFDTVNGWLIEGSPGLSNMADLEGISPVDFNSVRGELGELKEGGDGIKERDDVKDELAGKEESLWRLEQEKGENGVMERSEEMDSERVSEKVDEKGVLGGDGPIRNLGGLTLGCLIEEQLGKVSLEGASNCFVPIAPSENDENVGGGGVRQGACISDAGGVAVVVENEMKIDENGGDEESESESLSSSSSSSSSSDEEEEDEEIGSDEEEEDEESGKMIGEKKVKNEEGTLDEQTDEEDGEIMSSDIEKMVVWGDDEYADDDGGSRPILSKNEVKNLPLVPSVDVTLEPHHQTLPVGTILSIIGSQAIVEGVEKHDPLNEGSILWITESRSPLGIIDEIFGPVKNPYYIVRYNSETEVPPGIQQGTSISFVQEFADHVLNDKGLYQKGYDASGDNDEELSDEMEFSDDEKEAEYKRALKMKKRGTDEYKPGNKRNEKRRLKNQKRNWNKNQDPVETSLNRGNGTSLSGFEQGSGGDQAVVPQFPQRPQGPGLSSPNGFWNNGFPHHQQQGVNLPTGVTADGMVQMQPNVPFQLYQTPLQPNATFQQQIGTIPGLGLNFNAMGGQPNFVGPPMLAPWAMGLDQNVLNSLQFGMGLQMQAQQASLTLNGGGGQGVQSQGSQNSHNLQPSPAASNINQGRGLGRGGGGGRGHQRGRGRFGGGRGRHSSAF